MLKQAARRRPVARLPREQRLSGLLAAARAVFSERGYQDTTTAEIADRAGVVEGTIYHYFPTKRSLLIRVLEVWYADIIPDYPQVLGHVEGARAKLRYLIWQHLRVVHGDPVLCRFGIEIRDDDGYEDTEVYSLNRRYGNAIMQVIADGITAGEIRPSVSSRIVRDMIFGTIEYLTHGYLQGQGDFSVDGLADEITEQMFAGLAMPARDEPLDSIVARLEAATARLKGQGAASRPDR